MTGFLEDNVLRFEGLSDQDIADLNAILPDLEILNQQVGLEWLTVVRLIAAFNTQWPRIQKVMPIIQRIAGKIIAEQKELS